MDSYVFWPGFIQWAGLVAWVLLAFTLALALYQLHRESQEPPRLGEPPLYAFFSAAWARALAWLVGVVGAILPNLSGLLEGICGIATPCDPNSVAPPYVSTAASIALVTAGTTLLGSRRLIDRAKASDSVVTKCATAVFVATVVCIALYYTWLSNTLVEGPGISQAWFWFLLCVSVVASVGAEAWMAHAALIDRRKSP